MARKAPECSAPFAVSRPVVTGGGEEGGETAGETPAGDGIRGYRGHVLYLAKGGDLSAMTAELYGKATGCTGGKGPVCFQAPP